MEKVKRYTCILGVDGMFSDSGEGEYVSYDDYNALLEAYNRVLGSTPVCSHEPQHRVFNSDSNIERCDECGEITN